jgi:hypothetical protein
VGGKLVHRVLDEKRAKLVARAIANYREIMRLLTQWEAETVAEILEEGKNSNKANRR